jgi:hypothetical protein
MNLIIKCLLRKSVSIYRLVAEASPNAQPQISKAHAIREHSTYCSWGLKFGDFLLPNNSETLYSNAKITIFIKSVAFYEKIMINSFSFFTD